jgi:thiol-disulfide isomerase/thioredoxin
MKAKCVVIGLCVSFGIAGWASGQPATGDTAESDPTEPQPLGVGDKAPPLKIAEWVKGEPIKDFEPGRVYAIEFWATWCGPCIAGIPHLAAVQEKFKEHADLISVTREDPSNTLEMVREFVAQRDEEMAYRVAFDEVDVTWRSYMDAAEQTGIPCAFIIDKQGRVAWIGHPAMDEFERTIDAIIKDEFDFEAAERERAEAAARARQLATIKGDLHTAWEAGDHERALTLADEIIEPDPAAMTQWVWWKFESLMVGIDRPDRASAFVRTMMDGPFRDDPVMLRRFTYGIADSLGIDEPDLDLALELAERSVTLTFAQDYEYLIALAMVRMAREEYDEGIAVMERAIDLAPTEARKAYLRNELEFYRMDKEMAEDDE